MAITSVGYAGSIGWADWSNLARSLGIDYGVVGESDLAVTINNAATGTVDVALGTAFGCGVFDTLDGVQTVTGLSANNTWYTIVVRRDWTPGPGSEVTTLVALAGTSARNISASRVTGPGVVDEQPIALVQRGASALVAVVDLRCWWGNGGARAATTDALAYLDRPGSTVRVGDQDWSLATGGTWSLTSVVVDQVPSLPASKVTSGAFHVDRIPNLPASKITSGTFHADRIPSIPATKVTSGTLHSDRIPNLNASKITAGTLADGRIPSLAASKIASGTFADARIPNLNASKITAGTLPVSRGGTGATTAAAARTALGLAAMAQSNTGSTLVQRNSAGGISVGAISASDFCRSAGGWLFGDTTIGMTRDASDLWLNAGGDNSLGVSGVTGRLFAEGVYNNPISGSANITINSSGTIARASSSIRYKDDVDVAPDMPRVLDIIPRTWVPKGGYGDAGTRFYGAIAEELDELGLTYLVDYNNEGQPEGINYDRIPVALIPLIREQERRIVELEAAVQSLRGQ